jgi:hypothetical protein
MFVSKETNYTLTLDDDEFAALLRIIEGACLPDKRIFYNIVREYGKGKNS